MFFIQLFEFKSHLLDLTYIINFIFFLDIFYYLPILLNGYRDIRGDLIIIILHLYILDMILFQNFESKSLF